MTGILMRAHGESCVALSCLLDKNVLVGTNIQSDIRRDAPGVIVHHSDTAEMSRGCHHKIKDGEVLLIDVDKARFQIILGVGNIKHIHSYAC